MVTLRYEVPEMPEANGLETGREQAQPRHHRGSGCPVSSPAKHATVLCCSVSLRAERCPPSPYFRHPSGHTSEVSTAPWRIPGVMLRDPPVHPCAVPVRDRYVCFCRPHGPVKGKGH